MAQSPILKINLLSTSQSGKETTINDAISALEKSWNAGQTLNFSAADITLEELDHLRFFYWVCTNVSVARTLNVPDAVRIFCVDNSLGEDTMTVTATGGSRYIPAGEVFMLAQSGGDLVVLGNSVTASVTAFVDLADVPHLSGNGGKALFVKTDDSGIEWKDVEGGGPSALTINDQTDSYTLVLGDAGKYVRLNKATAVNLTVPANSAAAFAVGTAIPVRQVGAGQVTVVAGSGVTINTAETLKLRKQHSGATLIKVDMNVWDLVGDLEVAP